MATTPNYNFIMPDPTDLVTDLPADFEIFGDEVDLRVKALNPETTEGDLAYRGATADAKDRLGIGTAGQVLAVNAGENAPEWISPVTAVPLSYTLINAGGTALTGSATTTISGISGFSNLVVLVDEAKCGTASGILSLRINGVSTGDYRVIGSQNTYAAAYAAFNFSDRGDLTANNIRLARFSNNVNSEASGVLRIDGANSTGFKAFTSIGAASAVGGASQEHYALQGIFNGIATISEVSVNSSAGNFTNGTIFVFGA